MNENYDFLIESKLRSLRQDLSDNYKNAVATMSKALDKVDIIFADFTNHALRHCLTILDFCNMLIGDNINLLNEDEIYILMMAVLFHDYGMSISDKVFDSLKYKVVGEENLKNDANLTNKDIVRKYHHLFSEELIRKYAYVFEIESEEHVDCIAKVARGHRKVDLLDTKEYDPNFSLSNGNRVCLPYLAALIRLADELDIAKDRNPVELYKLHLGDVHWRKHMSIEHLCVLDDCFKLDVSFVDKESYEVVKEELEKLKITLAYCVEVINKHTPFHLKQTELIINELV